MSFLNFKSILNFIQSFTSIHFKFFEISLKIFFQLIITPTIIQLWMVKLTGINSFSYETETRKLTQSTNLGKRNKLSRILLHVNALFIILYGSYCFQNEEERRSSKAIIVYFIGVLPLCNVLTTILFFKEGELIDLLNFFKGFKQRDCKYWKYFYLFI
jgi:hypothetical protein